MNDGTAARRPSASSRAARSRQNAPRLAASIAPGPPPVATRNPARASDCPRRRGRGVRRRAARGGVAAHDPDHGPAGDQLIQGVGHRVVVDRPQQGHERVPAGGGVARPAVRAGVRRGGVAGGDQPGVQLLGPVEGRPVGVDRGVRVAGKDQGATAAQVVLQLRRQLPPEHDQPLEVGAGQQGRRPAAQVEALQPQAGERGGPRQRPVQRVQALDLHGGILAGPGAARAPGPARRTTRRCGRLSGPGRPGPPCGGSACPRGRRARRRRGWPPRRPAGR